MPVLDRLRGTRVVADAAAIDRLVAALPTATVVIRPAPDDAFLNDVVAANIQVDDPHAIVVDEPGFVGAWCTLDDLRRHLEWTPPSERPSLAQGAVAGVPAKFWIATDERVFLVTAAAYGNVLAERLRWTR